jgi:hypothetical protein
MNETNTDILAQATEALKFANITIEDMNEAVTDLKRQLKQKQIRLEKEEYLTSFLKELILEIKND